MQQPVPLQISCFPSSFSRVLHIISVPHGPALEFWFCHLLAVIFSKLFSFSEPWCPHLENGATWKGGQESLQGIIDIPGI